MEKSMKNVNAILAHDAFWGIGKDGDLPWPKNSDDLKWFKEKTVGGVVVMGRKTWESLHVKPLPNRLNYVISSSNNISRGYHGTYGGDNIVEVIKDKIVKRYSDQSKIWIIGGAQLVESCLEIIDELWLNDVGGVYDCDTFLPKQKITEQFHMGSVEVLSFGIITKWVKR
jgi:dihydrofolate reductase